MEAAKERAENEQGVTFMYPDTAPFQEICLPMHESILEQYPDLRQFYDAIQEYNKTYSGGSSEGGSDT